MTKWLLRTPLHPQWLLGKRSVPAELLACAGRIADVGSADKWLQSRLPPETDYVAIDFPGEHGGAYAANPDVFANAESLPFADEVFDAIACFEVLEHLRDPQKAINEARRVLRPGGLYVISVPFVYPLHDRPADFRRYTPFGLQQALTLAGLEVVVVRPMLSSLRAAGLLMALAVAGGALNSKRRWLLLPLAVPLVLAINLVASLGARLWPQWDGIAMGYEAVGRKP